MQPLRIASCMAPNMDFVGRTVAQTITRRLGIPTVYVDDIPWPDRERQLDAGQIQIGWICGLPVVWKLDRPDPVVSLLAAPVPEGTRYAGQPVYFSDIMVHRDSPYRTFADLRGASWAYNEPRSHSGYNVMRWYLARNGHTLRYFNRHIEAGSHQQAIQLLLRGEADCAAIDTTVYALEVARIPSIADRLRPIVALGPSPAPPWVASTLLPLSLRRELQELFHEMHHDPAMQQALTAAQFRRFVAVRFADYDPIRAMDALARQAALTRSGGLPRPGQT